MKNTRQIVRAGIMVVAVATLAGCTTAGPFVTSISSDGKGNLIVEKNTVHFNAFMGTVASGDVPTTVVIHVVSDSGQQQK
jgi:type IV secretion system protein VirB7